MTIALIVAGLATVPAAATAARSDSVTRPSKDMAVQPATPPLRFEPNLGQFSDDVRYVARAKHGAILVEDDAIVFASGGARVRMSAGGASATTFDEPGRLLPGVTNYLIGDDPEQWKTGIPGYERVTRRGLYHGIDLVLHENSGRIEYDFEIAPGVDPSIVALAFDGADAVDVSGDGALTLTTSAGSIRHLSPVAYQVVRGERLPVATRFERRADGTTGFAVSRFDPATPLIIDPIVEFSLVFGGTADDTLTDLKTTGDGGVVISGWSLSFDIPLAHPIQTDPNESSIDSFITRLDATGSNLIFSTYLGGRSGDDKIEEIALDTVDAVYVTGLTQSIDFPLVSPIATTVGGYGEGFVTALAPDGSSIVYSTYLGGRGYDGCSAIAVDAAGRVTVAGHTESRDFPSVQAMELGNGGLLSHGPDAFVATIGPRGTGLELASVFGGDYEEFATQVIVWDGGIAVTGTTQSYDFPVVNAYSSTFAGSEDAFLISFAPGERKPVFSTYLGGDGSDVPVGLMRDDNGEFVVAGATGSTNFPTVNPLQVDEDLYFGDVFVTRFRSAGSVLFSTYFGSPTLHDYPAEAEMASDGSIYVTGLTQSIDFPEVSPIQPSPEAGYYAAGFLSQISGHGDRVLMSSYLTGWGTGGGLSLDESGNLWMAGYADVAGLDIRNPFAIPGYSVNPTISRIVRSSAVIEMQVDASDPVAQGAIVTVPVTITNDGPGTAGDLSFNIHAAEGGQLVFARGALATSRIPDGSRAGDVVVRVPALGPGQLEVVELGILVNGSPGSNLSMTVRVSTTAWLNGQPTPVSTVRASVVPQAVQPPVITMARLIGFGDKFRVRLNGSGFVAGAAIIIGEDTTSWPNVKLKGSRVLLLKGGFSLEERFPMGVQIPIRVVNPDGGEVTSLVIR